MNISGVINSLEDFEKLVEQTRFRRVESIGLNIPSRQEYYRGQLSSSWSIKPGLPRELKSAEAVVEAEKKIIDFFKEEMTKRSYTHKVLLHKNPRTHQNEWAWLTQAQHYRIPTRFLAWPLKPEVALYFAVEDSALDNVDGQFLIMYVSQSDFKTEETYQEEQYYDIPPTDIKETWFLNPCFYDLGEDNDTTAEIRRARQHGKFSLQPHEFSLKGLDEQNEFLHPWKKGTGTVIEKYIIPAKAKPQMRLDLISKGWHGEYLYVNDDAVINEITNGCKIILSDIIKRENAVAGK